MGLLKKILEKIDDFTLVDRDGEELVKGQFRLYYKDDDYNDVKAKWLAFRVYGATPEELLEFRKWGQQLVLFRVAAWDLELTPGVLVELTEKGLKAVPDDLLEDIIKCIEAVRTPEATNAS